MKINEEIGNKKGIATSYNNIGNVYNAQGNSVEALKNYLASLKLKEEMGNKQGIAISYGNIGNVYKKDGNYTEALKNFSASLKIDEEIGNKKGVAVSNNNIGGIYYLQGNYSEALKMHFASLKIKEEIGDKEGMASTLGNIGLIYQDLENYKEEEAYSTKSLALAEEIGALGLIKTASQNLSEVCAATGRYKEALEYYKAYIIARDSLFNEENTKKTVQMQMQYEFDKKEVSTKLEQGKKDAVASAESRKQKIIIWSVCGILILVIGFAVFAYRSFLQKRKANIEITKQKEIIEEKQKEILDSIHYAKRIQTALITSEKYIEKNLKRLKMDA